MPDICLKVRGKIAEAEGSPTIICGNSDYLLHFDLDEEWAPYHAKTVRFYWYDYRRSAYLHTDVLFEGLTAEVPVMRNTSEVAVGIYAGDLHASAPVRIPCLPAVTDGLDITDPLPPNLYVQLAAYLRDLAQDRKSVV